ncbi:MAG: metallophosphoesterase [Patescibacteria group bacterium]|nr:metallophosphoesterase [Patescibacteria group bacterium]
MATNLTRRRFLGMASAAVVAPAMAANASRGADSSAASQPLRFAHFTDSHVQPEANAEQGLIRCIKAAEAHKPEFVLTGGDLVMDVADQDGARAEVLFDQYQRVLQENTQLKFYPCLGNHDVFGWSNRRGVAPDHPLYGKKMFCERFGLDRTYYRFDRGGWRFYVLDDIQPTPDNRYQAYLDEEQLEWLKADLQAKPAEMPAAVVCHIPILSVTIFDTGGMWREEENAYHISTRQMCRGAVDLAMLFSQHNVKLALSGHTHRVDRVEYRGVTFICGGAVCGAWWREQAYRGFPAGFGLIDLYANGDFNYSFQQYEWAGPA